MFFKYFTKASLLLLLLFIFHIKKREEVGNIQWKCLLNIEMYTRYIIIIIVVHS